MKRQILLVEDEAAIAGYLGTFLEQEGFEVTRAPTVARAKELSHHRFDLIMLDLNLPDGTGDELLPFLKQAQPATPVLMVTGAALEDDRIVKCLQSGAVGCVNKAARLEEIIHQLRRALSD